MPIDENREFLPVRIAVLTVSDTRGLAEDRSGDALVERLTTAGHVLAARAIERDDLDAIIERLATWIADPDIDVILTTEESTTWAGEPWAAEARRRLAAHVFPALRDTRAHLRVALVDREARGQLDLLGASHLGFEAILRAHPPKVTILFEGPAPRTSP